MLAVRIADAPSSVPTERLHTAANQRRVEEAFRLLGTLAARIVTDPNPSAYVLDLASQDGALQTVWCRGHHDPVVPEGSLMAVDPASITAGAFGPVNAERYVRAQKALSALLVELARPGCDGSATLRMRGDAGELAEDIRGESHRRWRF
jgi:hypothetical protein